MKKLIVKIRTSIEGVLRRLCGKIGPDKRFFTVVMMVTVFLAVNMYITIRAICNIGREDAVRGPIELAPVEIPDSVTGDTLPDKVQKEMENFFNRFNPRSDDRGNKE